MNRGKAIDTVPVHEAKTVLAHGGSDLVEGFHIPETVSYHSGHSWVMRERKNLVRVGADEFAAALLGKVSGSSCRSPANGFGRDRK